MNGFPVILGIEASELSSFMCLNASPDAHMLSCSQSKRFILDSRFTSGVA